MWALMAASFFCWSWRTISQMKTIVAKSQTAAAGFMSPSTSTSSMVVSAIHSIAVRRSSWTQPHQVESKRSVLLLYRSEMKSFGDIQLRPRARAPRRGQKKAMKAMAMQRALM